MASAWDGATARVSGHRLRRRTGTVFNYAEDAHLRDDLPCGCALCETCDNDAGRIGDGLDGNPVGTPLAPDATHYLVPDATSIAEYVDFLEMRDAAKNIILLQSEARQVHRRGNTRLSKTTARRVQRSTAESAAVPERALRAHVRRRRA